MVCFGKTGSRFGVSCLCQKIKAFPKVDCGKLPKECFVFPALPRRQVPQHQLLVAAQKFGCVCLVHMSRIEDQILIALIEQHRQLAVRQMRVVIYAIKAEMKQRIRYKRVFGNQPCNFAPCVKFGVCHRFSQLGSAVTAQGNGKMRDAGARITAEDSQGQMPFCSVSVKTKNVCSLLSLVKITLQKKAVFFRRRRDKDPYHAESSKRVAQESGQIFLLRRDFHSCR